MNLNLSGCEITIDPTRLAIELVKALFIINSANQNAIDWPERQAATYIENLFYHLSI